MFSLVKKSYKNRETKWLKRQKAKYLHMNLGKTIQRMKYYVSRFGITTLHSKDQRINWNDMVLNVCWLFEIKVNRFELAILKQSKCFTTEHLWG